MSEFNPLLEELEQWQQAGKTASFWWRDDDAQRATPALYKLLQLSRRHHIPLALASVPDGAEQSLAEAIDELPGVAILQHGYSHRNYAPPTQKKQELGAHRPLTEITDELHYGRHRLQRLFGRRFVPVLVPPWNRIAPELYPLLPETGFRGLSVSGPRDCRYPLMGLQQVNVHVDIIDWRGGRGFVGTAHAVQQCVRHLAARRQGDVDTDEATGLMTHHLVHDAGCWFFLEQLLSLLEEHPAVRCPPASGLFQC